MAVTKSKGRFKMRIDKAALNFSSSLSFDKRLYKEDILVSIVHAEMLAKQNIISTEESRKIISALLEIQQDIQSGKLPLDMQETANIRFASEDIHMAIEKQLMKKIGETGGKLHTARSRNDQIATDERLYLRDTILALNKLLNRMQSALVSKADKYIDIIIPGYTHLQRAQPILLSHHLLAYVSMLERDKERLSDCYKRVNLSPLGSGALAGTSFPIDREYTAKKLGFSGIIENSIDAVSDRDVQTEFISDCAIIMMHLSRFAEELVMWNSEEWNFIEIGEGFTTGSSIMPQKKNPDIAELIRGKTGRVYGDLITLFTIMKGLPLAYNRDLQEDKEALFDASDTVTDCLNIFTAMLKTIKFKQDAFHNIIEQDHLLATDIADYLVKRGLPFRKSHTIAGSIVQYCIEKNIPLKKLSLSEYQKFSNQITSDIYSILDIKSSVSGKKSTGSTSPKEVKRSIQYWKRKLQTRPSFMFS